MSRWAELEAKYGARTANLGPMSRGAWRLYWEAMEATEAEYLTHFNVGVPMDSSGKAPRETGVAQSPDIAVPSITTAVDTANFYRARIKVTAGGIKHAIETLRRGGLPASVPGADVGEIIANFTLAYRHLEDASQRLGKAIQAADGGISVYDRETTVGA